jgi:hypothetical protein
LVEPHELPWDPLTPPEVVPLFAGWDRFWCIAGGWSIDLSAGQMSREHEDVDVLVLRRDLVALHAQLPHWELWVSWPPGTLIPWLPGELIDGKAHDIWCREAGTERWRFQLMVMDHDDEHWIFRRDWTIGGPLATLAREVGGVPVLAPEIQLLYKGNGVRRPKDEADFRTALPHLTPEQRAWLRAALASREPDHPWLPMLASSAL